MRKYILKDKKLSILSKIIILALWITLSEIIDNEIIFPTIKSTLISLGNIIKRPDFPSIIGYSLLRSLIGFFISLFLSLVLGILSSLSKLIYNLMLPILNFLSSVPTIAIILLALIWLPNEIAPMFVGFIMIFPILYETVLKAILNIDKEIIDMAKLYKVNMLTIIKDIYIPSILNKLSLVFNSTVGMNLKMVIGGEVLAQPKYAIGSSLQLEKIYLNTSGVFAWIVVILLIVSFLKYVLLGINRIFLINKWK